MRSLLKKTGLLLGALIALDLALLGVFCLVWYALASDRAEVALLELDIADQLARERTTNASERLIADLEARQGAIDTFVLPSDGAVQFLETVETLAAESSLALEVQSVSVEPISSEEGGSLEALKLAGRAEGSWSNLFRFLALLESVPLSLSVRELNLNKAGGSENTSSWALLFIVTAAEFKR